MNDTHLEISLVTLGDPGRLTGGYLYHLRMAELARRHRARIRFLSFPALPGPLPALAGGAIVRRIRRERPAAVVVDSIAAAFLAPWLPMLGVPVVGSLHQPPGGMDHAALRTRLAAPLDLFVYRRAGMLILASDSLAEDLVAAGLPRNALRVVPPGRDAAPAPPGAERDLRQGRKAAVLCVANWIPRKEILNLLEAIARLPADDVTLHLAGDDHADARYAARVRRRLQAPDLAGRVLVHGPVSRRRVAGLYRDADIFVLATRREPFGTVWGEAMAAGLPVVGWNAGNLPHLAVHEREALLVPTGDVRGLSDAIGRLVRDEELRLRLGEAGRGRARTRPTWEESAAAFFRAIREAVG